MEPLPIVAALAVAGALFLAAFTFTGQGDDRRSKVAVRLSRQSGIGSAVAVEEKSLPESALRRQGRFEQQLHEAPVLSGWRRDLSRSGLTWRLSDYLCIIAAVAGAAALVGFIATGAVLAALGAATLGALTPILLVKRRVASRTAKLNSQLVDTIDLVAASLRSGFGFLQSLELAASDQPDPFAAELKRTIREIGLGASVEDALERLAARTGDDDLDLVVTAVLIQRRVGGNLAEVLSNISSMIRERIRVRGEINTLTAQARMSSWIVGLLPIGFGAFMTITQPDYMSVMWTENLGRLLVGVSVALELIGFYIVRRIAAIQY